MKTKSPTFVGLEEALENLKSGIDQLSTYEKMPNRIFAAVSGSRLQNKKLHAALSKMYPACVVNVESDIHCISGMLPPSPVCVAANVGTGSIVCGFKGASFDRVGGWGYLFDDPGSVYDIGKRVLATAHEYADGLCEISEVARLVEIKLGASVRKFTDVIHLNGRNFISSFAPIAFEALAVGDETANRIISESADGIARLINHMYSTEQYGNNAFILCNFQKHSDIMCDFIEKRLTPGISAEFCTTPSVLGAMKMCMRYEYGEMDFEEFTRKFHLSYFKRTP
jgi:N-acetylglucosamine kinase-like BadF-type ATPase